MGRVAAGLTGSGSGSSLQITIRGVTVPISLHRSVDVLHLGICHRREGTKHAYSGDVPEQLKSRYV